jgi:hypothetical protein
MELKKINKIIVFLVTLILFTIGNFISLNIYGLNDNFENKWLILTILCFFILLLNANVKFVIKKNKIPIITLWEILIISIFISKYTHGTFSLPEFLLYSILIPFTLFNSKILGFKVPIMLASMFSIIPLIFFIGESNTLGVILSIAGINIINFLKIREVKEKYIYMFMLLIGILIFITSSRTSLISYIVIIATYMFIVLINNKAISYTRLLKKGIFLVFITIIIMFSIGKINNLLFEKYNHSNQDMLSGRGEMWEGTLNTGVHLLGNGESYFLHYYNIGDAHNTLIQVLGSYGTISSCVLLIIFIYIILRSLKLKNLVYFSFFSAFFILGLAENLFFINSRMIHINILFLVYFGCLINENKQVSLK